MQDLIAELGHAYHRRINLASDSHRLALLRYRPVCYVFDSSPVTDRAQLERVT